MNITITKDEFKYYYQSTNMVYMLCPICGNKIWTDEPEIGDEYECVCGNMLVVE